MANRRNFSRVPLVGFVDIKMVDRKQSYTGFIEQISRGGIGIYTKDKIRSEGRVVLELRCFVGNDSLDFSISGTINSSGGIISSLKKKRELEVVAIKFDQEINTFDHQSLYNCLIENDSKQKRRELFRLI